MTFTVSALTTNCDTSQLLAYSDISSESDREFFFNANLFLFAKFACAYET